ncbi:class I SAM-dependent methyltransferase [Candidatus Microgenomates bacterium]|nr:MAG: class I SAM-dependent methyltransferase [Candidatus Microgenomates bacterium]
MKNKCSVCFFGSLQKILTTGKYKIYHCDFCKCVRVAPFPSDKEIEAYYKKFDYKTGFVTEKLIRKEAKKTLKILSKYKRTGSLLDIGCGAGFYLDEAKKRGWSVTGVEMSKQLSEYANKNLQVKVLNQDFLKTNLKPRKFDIVILSQVIEHLKDPYPMLAKIHKVLNDDGLLYIATPNIESWLFYIQKELFPYIIPLEHVFLYGPRSLTILLNKSGFKVKAISTYGYQQDLAAIIKHLVKKKDIRQSSLEPSANYQEYPNHPVKLLKYIIFDKLLCGSLHRLLNMKNRGSMVQIIAEKCPR